MYKEKELARINLSTREDLVISLVNNHELDIRIYVRIKHYTGFTKQGVRFCLLNGCWKRFYGAIQKINKEYQEIH